MTPPTPERLALPDRGVELAVLDWGGTGPLALLAHANGFCAGMYDPFVRALGDRYRVIGYDARGHGDSDAPAPPAGYAWQNFVDDLLSLVPKLLERTGAPRVECAIGHSFGGTTCMMAACARPDWFGELALLDPVVFPPASERPELFGDGPHPMAEVARRRRTRFESRAAALERWRPRPPFDAFDPRAFELYGTCGMRDRPDGSVELKCAAEVEAAVFEMGGEFDLYATVSTLRTPGTLFWAKQGNFPRLLIDRLLKQATTLSLVEVDLPHLLPLVDPDAVGRLVLEHTARP